MGSVPEQDVLAKLSTNFAMLLTTYVETKNPFHCIAHSGGEIWFNVAALTVSYVDLEWHFTQ